MGSLYYKKKKKINEDHKLINDEGESRVTICMIYNWFNLSAWSEGVWGRGKKKKREKAIAVLRIPNIQMMHRFIHKKMVFNPHF